MRSCSIVIVNYRTASLARTAVASARAGASSPIEIVVVDNSESAEEADALSGCGADRVIVAPRNLGYGAGVNRGASEASGDVLIAANPDVIFHPGSIDALLNVARDRVIAGPALFWDSACTWRLPPADLPTAAQKVAQLRASRSVLYARRRDAARARARVRFWSLDSTATVEAISGAVMAIPRGLFERAGGFDEQFFLYYEEMDLIRAIRRLGGQVMYVPESRCTHLYNQSAASNASAGGHFSRSEELYLRKWSGGSLVRVLQAYGKPLPAYDGFAPVARGRALSLEGIARERCAVEASSLATFETAAGTFPAEVEVNVPEEILRGYSAPELYVRAIEKDSGRVIRAWAMAM